MKKIGIILLSFLCIAQINLADNGVVDTLEKVGIKLPVETPTIFPTLLEEKQQKLADLQKEKKQLEDTGKTFAQTVTTHAEEVKVQLDLVTDGLKRDPEDEFLNKELALLNERYQIIKNLQQSREQLVAILDEHINLLQDYLKDPGLQEYKREHLAAREIYSLEDLQNLSQLIMEKERTIAQLIEQEKNVDAEIENRKRTAIATAESYKKKKEEQANLGVSSDSFDIGLKQKVTLLKLEEHLYTDKKERDDLRLREIEYKKALIKSRLFVERLQLDALKEDVAKVKPAIKVSEADVAVAKDELARKQQQSVALEEGYRQEIEALDREIKSKEAELQEMSAKLNIPLGLDLEEWARQPQETVQGYAGLFHVASLNDALLLLQRRKELLEAQISLEEKILYFEKIQVDLKNSFHKITAQKFISEEETKQERTTYEAPRSETKANQSLVKEQRTTEHERLNRQKKALINVKEMRQRLYDRKATLFKGHDQEYADCLEYLNTAEEKIQSQIDILGKISSVFADITGTLNATSKQIEFIIAELELTTIWQRSKHAITWEGVQNIMPNLEKFIGDIRTYVATVHGRDLLQPIKQKMQSPKDIAWLLIQGFIFVGIILSIRWVMPWIALLFIRLGKTYRGLRFISFFIAFLASFIGIYCASIAVWLLIVVLMHYPEMSDPFPYILLYLFSIPYLLYLANRFIHHFTKFNIEYDYVFISKDFQWRFITVGSVLLYATIAIFFFREAFLLAGYQRSELPTILLAINFIIFQISLIFLIAKEQILSIIPTTNEFWRWVGVQVDRFYYLILMLAIAIIVMSNPYVGFGKLVLWVLKRVVYTLILIRVLVWINAFFKRALSYVFFSRSGEEYMRERFAYAKTFYGFFAVAMLVFFIVTLCIVGAKIWHWPEALVKISSKADIMAWLETPIIGHQISVYSILKILFFIMLGFLFGILIDWLVIEKIFDALLVEPGVQNTISSIVRYIIAVVFIIFGFQSAGLGEIVWGLIVALIVGIGWVIKEPMGDFIAYFIILVQRPVKIGDYIQMDSEIFGVVRKITPRSVVIRRKNSTTIVLPNSTVINKPLVNWNYGRGFVAFDDIIITVSYKEDPSKVRELLLKVMDENTFVLKSPTPIVRLDNFGEFGFVFMARGFLSSNYTLDQWDIASDIRLAMVKRLRESGIQIALPIRITVSQENLRDKLLDDVFGEIKKN
ncbi:MAG TPA: mechanosensitive ion channel domain-containing protein [Candidatus Babeliales bacterium]|nr:mechanosensitive ion channel domain-containing protein [Candidatus Babeliales bacterium]